jgi:hypothetical protein
MFKERPPLEWPDIRRTRTPASIPVFKLSKMNQVKNIMALTKEDLGPGENSSDNGHYRERRRGKERMLSRVEGEINREGRCSN